MSRVPLTPLAVPCLRFARWEQAPDAFDVRCVRWPQRVPTGCRNQALAVEKRDLERSCRIKHLPEEEVSTGTGLIIPFWSVSWERAVGQPPATCSAWQRRQGCSHWGAERGLRRLKLPAPLLKGRKERRPVHAAGRSAPSIPHCAEIPERCFADRSPLVFHASQPQAVVACSRVEFSAALLPGFALQGAD